MAPWLSLALPMFLFAVLTAIEGQLPKGWYPAAYVVKAALVALALLVCARGWRPLLRRETRPILIGALAGVVGLFLWLALDAVTPQLTFLGTRTAFDPSVLGPWRVPFLCARFLGLVVLVPLLEELFWRGFLLRWLTDQDRWESLPLEKFSLAAAAIGSAAFALAHPEWLAALVYGLGLCYLLRVTKSLAACVAAHAVTNLLLGIYVLATGQWRLW